MAIMKCSRYPQIKGVSIVSAKKDTAEEFNKLIRDEICKIVSEMESVHTLFPKSWHLLMDDLQEMKTDYIDSKEFRKKCKDKGIDIQQDILDQIISWYQDLGVCFYSRRRPAERKYMVLKPKWLLNALYILSFNGRKYAKNGIIQEEDIIHKLICEPVPNKDIKKVWPDIRYKSDEIQYIISVLLNFNLVYKIDSDRFFVPMLCDENEPKVIGNFETEDWKLEKLGIHDKEYRHIPQIANACSYAESFLQEFGEYDEVFAERRSLLLKASDLCEKRGYIKDAVEYLERAVNVEGAYQEDFGKLLPRINSAAVLYYEGGKYKEAERLLIIYLQILDDKNCITAESGFDNLGYDLDVLLELDDATKYGGAFNNLARVYKEQGDYGKALEYYRKALKIAERMLGKEDPNTATMYNNMGIVYEAQMEYEKALEYYVKALDVKERVLGSDHPDTAATYNNMAGVYQNQGEYEKALEYYGKALEVRVRVLGSDHPLTAASYNNMAVVCQAQGEYEKALEYYGKALEVSERVLGRDHPDTAATYHNMAGVYLACGDYEKALEYLEKALTVFMAKLGVNHPYTQITQRNVQYLKSLIKLD